MFRWQGRGNYFENYLTLNMIVFLNIHYVLHAGLENLSELLSELQVSDFFFIQYETIYFTELFNYCCCYHYWDFQTCDTDAVNFTKSRHRILRVFKFTESTLPVKLWKIMWIMFFSYCYFITCFWIYSIEALDYLKSVYFQIKVKDIWKKH